MAKHLSVNKEVLLEVLSCYRSKSGLYTRINNHIIYLESYLGGMKYRLFSM